MGLLGGMSECRLVELLQATKVRSILESIVANAVRKEGGIVNGKTNSRDEDVWVCKADEALKAYERVPVDDKKALANVINSDSVLMFAVSGCNVESISIIWDYCKRVMAAGHDASALKHVLLFYFELLAKTNRGNQLEWLDSKIGDPYDDEINQIDSSSDAIGRVVTVHLQGYRFLRGKVVRRSFVHVKK